MNKANVLIIGAGTIGQALRDALSIARQFNVYMLDARKDHAFADEDWFICADDFFNQPQKYLDREDSIRFQYLVMAVPMYDAGIVERVVQACNASYVNYFDFSEDEDARDNLTDIFETKQHGEVFIAPGCGLAPGMIQVVANSLAHDMDSVSKIEMFVGNLPVSATNDMRYRPMWSVDGVVNEYLKPTHVVLNKEIMQEKSLGAYKRIIIGGSEYESFNTSGGAGTMLEEWAGNADEVRYRTVRYVGHLAAVKAIMQAPIDDGFDAEHSELALRLKMSEARPLFPVEDIVLMHVCVEGKYANQDLCNIKTFRISGIGNRSAIQRATAGGLALIMLAHKVGETKSSGMFRHEEIDFSVFATTPFIHLSTWAGYVSV
jgi:saccharopine dehydrogenase-like NADP-dependent oxidoreductase